MKGPRVGFPIDCVAVTEADGRTEDTENDTFEFSFFDAKPYRVVSQTITGDQIESETCELDASITFRVRNRLKLPIEIGAELTILPGADGIGVMVVLECDED